MNTKEKTRAYAALCGIGLLSMSAIAETYYWTGKAEGYDSTAKTPKTSTVGNWALEDGSLPTAAPGVDDTLVFTNKASAEANGRVYVHATQDKMAVFSKVIMRDEGLVALYGDTDIYPCIPSEGVWNYTEDGTVYFGGGSLRTVSGTAADACHTSTVYVANKNASVVNDGKLYPGSYVALVKQGNGLFNPVNKNSRKYSSVCLHVAEGGTYEIGSISSNRDWDRDSFQFAGDNSPCTMSFMGKGDYCVGTSLTEKNVTQAKHVLTDSGKGSTLVLSNGSTKAVFASSRFSGVLGGTLSLAFYANNKSDRTLTLARGTSTSTGALKVGNGKAYLTEGAQYRTLSAVTIGDGTTYPAELSVEDGASLKSTTLAIGANGTLSIAKGLKVEADSFTRRGVPQGDGLYMAADDVGIAGEGVLRVGNVDLSVPYDQTGKTATVLDRTSMPVSHEAVAAYGKIQVALSEPILVPDSETNRLEIANYALSAGLLPEDFVDVTAKTDGLPFTWFETEAKDGVTKVYLCSRPVITASFTEKGNAGTYYFMKEEDKAMWSDGKVPHAGADYLIALGSASRPAFYDTVENGETAFPGETLTMDASSYRVGNDSFHIDLRFYNQDGEDYRTLFVADNKQQRTISGTAWVDESCTAMRISGGKDSVATVESTISGSAGFGLKKMWDGSENMTFRMYGNNSGLTGAFGVYGNYNDRTEAWNSITVAITNSNALGGALKKSSREGLRFEWFPKLFVGDDVVYETPNRHLFGQNGLRVEVAEGKTFAVRNIYRCYIGYGEKEKTYIPDRCCIEKSGSGVLALTEVIPCKNNDELNPATANGTNNLVRVVEGGVQPLAASTFDNLAVAFADGTSIVVDPTNAETSEFGLRMTAYEPTFAEGAKIRLALPSGVEPSRGQKVVFLTAPASVGDLSARFRVMRIKTAEGTFRGVVTSEAVDVGGVACTRYSVTYDIFGSVLVLR